MSVLDTIDELHRKIRLLEDETDNLTAIIYKRDETISELEGENGELRERLEALGEPV